MERFSKDVRLITPIGKRKKGTKEIYDKKARYVVTEAYCPNGCNIIDMEHEINSAPGLRIKFKRPGMEREFVLSVIQDDFDRIQTRGQDMPEKVNQFTLDKNPFRSRFKNKRAQERKEVDVCRLHRLKSPNLSQF